MDKGQAKILCDELQGKEVGGWLIDGFHGNGKSAVVLPARKDGITGAIKVFHPELVERYGKDAQLERIMREKSLVGVHHENLVQILDGGECPNSGHLFVVMESLPYRNLHDKLSDIPLGAIPRIISQAASAARFLEDRRLAHRDIKPENIAISDDFSRAVLLDLGVLLPIGASNLTDVDQRLFIGTLRYSSPEFLVREEADTIEGWRAVTFYQLGAVLHDLLMKQVLFEEFSEPFSRLVEAVKSETPRIASEDHRSVELANRCLVKNPNTRLELVSWNDFAADGSVATQVIAARERIAQRQRYYQDMPGPQRPNVADNRQIKQILDDACNRFESRLAALINGAGFFPLRTTRSAKDVPSRKSSIGLQFERDEDLGLPYRLTIFFELEMIDQNAGVPVFRVAAAGALSIEPVAGLSLEPGDKFYSGSLTVLLDGSPLEDVLIGYLEAAYRSVDTGVEPTSGLTVRLTLS